MLKNISPEEAQRRFDAGEVRLVDIREPAEFAQISIPGSTLAPLSVVHLQAFKEEGAPGKPVVFLCRTGRRTDAAAAKLQGLAEEVYQMAGGLQAWEKASLPVRRGPAQALPLNRQIFIAAGSLVLSGVVGSLFWPPLLWLSGIVGGGLVFAGVTGFCGMGILLSKMPWNK